MRSFDVAERKRRPTRDGVGGSGSYHLSVRRAIGELAEGFEAPEDVAIPDAPGGRYHRGMAVKAGARLLPLRDSPRRFLVLQHVCMTAPIAIVNPERVTGKHSGQPRPPPCLFIGGGCL